MLYNNLDIDNMHILDIFFALKQNNRFSYDFCFKDEFISGTHFFFAVQVLQQLTFYYTTVNIKITARV